MNDVYTEFSKKKWPLQALTLTLSKSDPNPKPSPRPDPHPGLRRSTRLAAPMVRTATRERRSDARSSDARCYERRSEML